MFACETVILQFRNRLSDWDDTQTFYREDEGNVP